MEERVTNDKKENEKVVCFRVDPKEYNILKQYAQIFSTTNRFKSLGQSKTADFLKLAITVFLLKCYINAYIFCGCVEIIVT